MEQVSYSGEMVQGLYSGEMVQGPDFGEMVQGLYSGEMVQGPDFGAKYISDFSLWQLLSGNRRLVLQQINKGYSLDKQR